MSESIQAGLFENALYREDLRAALEGVPPLDPLSGKRLLITGASGLVGSFLVDALMLANQERGLRIAVWGMARSGARLRERFAAHLKRSDFFPLARDVSDGGRWGDPFDYVIHAASPAHPAAFSLDPTGTMKANLLGTLNLLERGGFFRMLYVSSGEVYGENRDSQEDFREDSPGYIDCANPRSCYPESKRAAETLCVSHARQFGSDVVIARLCHTYGPTITSENSRADAQFLRNALQGQPIALKSAGLQIRSYLYVADAASGLLTALLAGQSSQAYNVANPASILSIRAYADLMAAAAGVPLRSEAPTETEKAGYSQITRATLDARKLMSLGYRPRYTAQEGIARTVRIMRDR